MPTHNDQMFCKGSKYRSMLCYTQYMLKDNGDAKRNIMYSQSAYLFLAIYFSLFTNLQQLKRIISRALSFLTVLWNCHMFQPVPTIRQAKSARRAGLARHTLSKKRSESTRRLAFVLKDAVAREVHLYAIEYFKLILVSAVTRTTCIVFVKRIKWFILHEMYI